MNTQTKKTSLLAKGFSYLGKKYVIIFGLLVFSIAAIATKNFPPGLYEDHGDLGMDSIALCEGCWDTEGWEFINETDCGNLSVEIAVVAGYNFVEANGEMVYKTMDIWLNSITIPGSYSFNEMYNFIQQRTAATGTIHITRAAFELKIAGYNGFAYPNGTTRFVNPDLPEGDPCKCLIWIPDVTGRKFTLKRC